MSSTADVTGPAIVCPAVPGGTAQTARPTPMGASLPGRAVALAPVVVPLADTIISAGAVDYLIVLLYFVVVLGIGVMARRQVSDSIDFFLSGRSLPAWVTGLAFISANLGAVEIMGMSASGAEFGLPTVHYFWVEIGRARVGKECRSRWSPYH